MFNFSNQIVEQRLRNASYIDDELAHFSHALQHNPPLYHVDMNDVQMLNALENMSVMHSMLVRASTLLPQALKHFRFAFIGVCVATFRLIVTPPKSISLFKIQSLMCY
jgi:hypothetical protein